MKKTIYSLPISFSVQNEISNNDTRFINVTIDVLHTGKNFNGSIFTKEVVDKNIDTIKNTPILGYISENKNEEKDFQGHEYIVSKKDGEVYRKYIGSAYGLIPESCNPRWINKVCDDGESREFLQVDALLWSKFEDSSSIMTNDLIKSQSMELDPDSIDGYEDDNGDFVFTSFSFDGCCILGDECEPAMINSTVEVQFSMNDFVRNIQNELKNKYDEFTKLVNDNALAQQAKEDNTFTKMVKEKNNKGGNKAMPNTDFTQTVMEQFADISTIVSQYEIMEDRWGDKVPRYYLHDIQDDEIIVVDCKNNYQYYGFPFTMNGDKAEIDFACGGKRKKTRYEDYEDGVSTPEGAFNFGNYIEEIESNAFEKVNEANEKVGEYEEKVSNAENAQKDAEENYSTVKAELDELKPKYEEFVKAEKERLDAELDAQKEAEFAKYETSLAEDVDFVALKEKKSEMSVKEIEAECAILYARKSLAQNNFSKLNNGLLSAGIVDDDEDNNNGFVVTKYGNIPVRR